MRKSIKIAGDLLIAMTLMGATGQCTTTGGDNCDSAAGWVCWWFQALTVDNNSGSGSGSSGSGSGSGSSGSGSGSSSGSSPNTDYIPTIPPITTTDLVGPFDGRLELEKGSVLIHLPASGGPTLYGIESIDSGGSTILRNDPEGTYTISGAADVSPSRHITFNYTFSAENMDAGDSLSPFNSISEVDAIDVPHTLSWVKPNEPVLGLTYSTFGGWTKIWPMEEGTSFLGGYFFTGIRTAPASMPKTGSARYSGLTVGTMIDANFARYSLEGDMALAVEFAGGSVDGNFTDMMKTSADGIAEPWRDFTLSGSITTETSLYDGITGARNFSGITNTNDGLLSGNAEGAFFGPGAAEVGGAWTLAGDGETAIGSFGGGKN